MSFDLTDEDYEAWRLSLADEELFGKNDDTYELRLPGDLKAAIAKKAAERGMTTAAYWRLAAMTFAFGPDHVGMLVAKRYGLVPGVVQQAARTTAPAGAI